ncbi:MAG TPA: DUF6125 family protein [Bacteroidia bacterium]|nr:DUF6125 family protein [Bacteroidia bacterium]HRS58458.1 DUF6125 family protein [Bacteroidia bacterium]HRU68584.1 DUF6125 family protein [Bacteroidia bacterium]
MKPHYNKSILIQLLSDFFHRSFMHYALWFSEARHQLGDEKAYLLIKKVWDQSFPLQMNRLAKTLGFELQDNLPVALHEKSEEELQALLSAMAANWLANDGIWFQAIEFQYGMNEAKRCNDSCWAQFSPFEAHAIKKMLQLPENAGLDGLKKSLAFRLYAFINEQEIVEETETSFVFRMKRCRVQDARKRKGLADYPCKSGGMVEYTTFAETIDKNIKTTCIGCPPDPHPEEWYCSWKFTI